MEIIQLFDKYLGSHKALKKNEYAYHCPFCHHHKQKLQINDKSYKFHCWTCNAGGNLLYLGKKVGMHENELIELSSLCNAYLSAIDRITKKNNGDWITTIKDILNELDEILEEDSHSTLLLPEEFKSALELTFTPLNPIEGQAISYLKKRGITKKQIIKYNIGFCDKGLYAGRIIVPSYDKNNQLNYFIARSIFADEKQKYKNPPVSKDVIVFENQINWKEPITLCEGVFDAIALKRNAIPLLGKFIQKKLDTEIKNKKVDSIYICLDSDAQTDALELYDKIKSYVKSVKNIKLEGKDAGENTFQNILKYQKNSVTLSWESLLKEKLYNISSSFIK